MFFPGSVMVSPDSDYQNLLDALEQAFQKGISEADIMAILTSMRDRQPVESTPAPDVVLPDHADFEMRDGVRIYPTTPEGLITVPDAATKYGLAQNTIQTWVFRGRIQSEGRVRGSARGGGFTLVDEGKLLAFMNGPRDRGGRPPKPRVAPC